MYIHEITPVSQFGQYRGIEFDSLGALRSAFHELGTMLAQPQDQVEALLERMLAQCESGMARSGLASVLMRGASEPAGPVAGIVTVTEGGWVIGGRFSEHNIYGLPQRAPFLKHSLRLNLASNDEGEVRYTLGITDKVSPTSLDPARVGLYHTECLLAARLGRPRPIVSVQVVVYYEPVGPEVSFDLEPVLAALASVPCLSRDSRPPEEIARGYFVHMTGDDYRDWRFQHRSHHRSGCLVRINGFGGIKERDDTLGKKVLMRQEGSRLIGPYEDVYRPIKPFVTLSVFPPDGSATDFELVAASNQLAADLADQVVNALWSNNVG